MNTVSGWRVFVLWLLSLLARALFVTLRFRISDADRELLHATPAGNVCAIWHNRILMSPAMLRSLRNGWPMFAMISASKDGAIITRIMAMLGIQACRGSSSKRASAALRELLRILRSGADVAITPDGPRGPVYSFHDGAATLALMSGAPVLVVCPNPRRALRFDSWDGLYLPGLFSIVDVRVRLIAHEDLPREREQCSAFLRDAMLELTCDLPDPPRLAAQKGRAQQDSQGELSHS